VAEHVVARIHHDALGAHARAGHPSRRYPVRMYRQQHTACLGPSKELIKIKCRTPSSPPLGQPRHLCMALKTCLGPPKEIIASCEVSRFQSLRANRDVITSQHVNFHGPPKDTTKATKKIHLSLAN
jgi:hypothetical protein